MTKESGISEKKKEMKIVEEVNMIKEILLKPEKQPELLLLKVLGRLHQLDISHHTLKSTLVGKAVSALKKHGSEKIRQRARALVDKWKRLVDEWLDAQKAEGGIYTTNEEAKPICDKTDEDEPNQALIQEEKPQAKTKTDFLQKPKRVILRFKGKPPIVIELEKKSNEALIQEKLLVQEDKRKCIDKAINIEAAAKRLQENYQEAESAKRQKRIQLIELHNLPARTKKAYIKEKESHH